MRNVLFGEWKLHPALWGLWILLTTAAFGFSVLLGGFYAEDEAVQQIGIATLATGTVCFLFVQFWINASRSDPNPLNSRYSPPKASSRAAAGGSSPENFDHLLGHTLERVPPAPQDGLVLFEPVPVVEGRPQTTPTEKAHHVLHGTALVDPAPMRHWPVAPEEPPKEAVPDYHAATLERRNAYITSLPLVEQILKAPSPASAKPTRTLGQCGGCGTKLWAPSTRPLRLSCPRCGRSSTLR